MKRIVIFGASGAGREVSDLIQRINKLELQYDLIGYIDNNKNLIGKNINGIPVLGGDDILEEMLAVETLYGVIAIAEPQIKEKIVLRFGDKIIWENIIDPTACISPWASLGRGNIVQFGVIIGPNTKIGNHCMFNASDKIGHDVVIEDYVSVMSSCCITGYVHLKKCVYIGTGVNIIPSKIICENTYICAGSTVFYDITVTGTYIGMPARRTIGIKTQKNGEE